MRHNEIDELTHHALLVAWGQFAQSIGLIQAVNAVPMHQKTVVHRPQTKILEFFVAIVAGLEHLKDLSRSAHPIDQDRAVAKAWLQPAWADYSGVSRTLSGLFQEEAEQVANALDSITQPILAEEVMKTLQLEGRLTYDGDLTDRPVSNGSSTYPNADFGHPGNALRLGYQAAMVSLHSPTYGRLWLSVVSHPGNTASCSQAEAMVLAAEAKTGLRPWRRTDLLRNRLQGVVVDRQGREDQVQATEAALMITQAKAAETPVQIDLQPALVAKLEVQYQQKRRPERPYSLLGRARHRLGVLERRQARLAKRITKLEDQLILRKRHRLSGSGMATATTAREVRG